MLTQAGKIYLFGGMNSLMNNTNELHEFDISLNIWRKILTKNTPPAIDSHKACLYQDKMIIGLGYSENDYNSKIY
jgi:N-acetylneuraminic acid mutarotase